MIVEQNRAMIVGVHTWDHSPVTGYFKTMSGETLDELPIGIAMQNGLLATDQFLMTLGSRDGHPAALLTRDITKTGQPTESSREYFRCGDLNEIFAD